MLQTTKSEEWHFSMDNIWENPRLKSLDVRMLRFLKKSTSQHHIKDIEKEFEYLDKSEVMESLMFEQRRIMLGWRASGLLGNREIR